MGEKKLVTHRESEVLRTDRDDDFNMDPRGQGERKRVAKTGAPVTEQKMCRHFFRESIFTNEGGTAGFACPLDKRACVFCAKVTVGKYISISNALRRRK